MKHTMSFAIFFAASTLCIRGGVAVPASAFSSTYAISGYWQRETIISAVGNPHLSRVILKLKYLTSDGDPDNNTAVIETALHLTNDEFASFPVVAYPTQQIEMGERCTIRREPGEFVFSFRHASFIGGFFGYTPDASFNRSLAKDKIATPSSAESLLLATDGLTVHFIEDVLLPSNPGLSLNDLLDLATHRITESDVDALERHGNRDNSVQNLIRLGANSKRMYSISSIPTLE